MLLRQDPNTSEKVIHSKYEDMIPAVLKDKDQDLEKKTEEEIQDVIQTLNQITEQTRDALERQINSKIFAQLPAKPAPKREDAVYVRFNFKIIKIHSYTSK
ncbi:SNW domain-containing protein 1 [Thelohanellus kitauei]|uniref:SNW domain-containing protein 1 n=1 Tax=Thelohanellus kitauei TaxID=669202 RepID=A0A0C2JHD9_THEKT|nr:SNW domain-containing protein 1 [Thelohanellus kitauei]